MKKSFLAAMDLAPFQALLGVILVAAGAVNATLIFDDLILVQTFERITSDKGLPSALRFFFLNEDLGGTEFRLYGLAKVLHLLVWEVAGTQAWLYGALIALTHFLTGLGIRRLLGYVRTDAFQAWAMTLVWMFSPFIVTACFHHYTYLILPYQLSLACGLVVHNTLRCEKRTLGYIAVALLGVMIALTGEAHIPAALLIVAMVAFATPSTMRIRLQALVLFGAAVVIAIVTYRFLYLSEITQAATQRFAFRDLGMSDIAELSASFAVSLPLGIAHQVRDIATFAAGWMLVPLIPAVVGGIYLWRARSDDSSPSDRDLVIPASLLLVALSGVLVTGVVSVFTHLVNEPLPRRYGYVPYTFAIMAIVGFFAAPRVRARARGILPAASVMIAIWLWLTLECVGLPIVRAQDGIVWSKVAKRLANKTTPAVLFVAATNPFWLKDFDVLSGVRGEGFPEIFESPLAGFTWAENYVHAVLGAPFAAHGVEDISESEVRLTGAAMSPRVRIVPPDSIIVVADQELSPDWRRHDGRLGVYDKWSDYQASVAAWGGKLLTGWDVITREFSAAQVAIDLGELSPMEPGLRDKNFDDPLPAGGAIANYGFESGDSVFFSPPHTSRSGWWTTLRNGDYVYRIDFLEPGKRIIALDWLDFWNRSPGRRVMVLDAAVDDRPWYMVGKIDLAALGDRVPVTLELPVDGKTFRVRLHTGFKGSDVPFLAGIRVIPRAHTDPNPPTHQLPPPLPDR